MIKDMVLAKGTFRTLGLGSLLVTSRGFKSHLLPVLYRVSHQNLRTSEFLELVQRLVTAVQGESLSCYLINVCVRLSLSNVDLLKYFVHLNHL